MCTKSPFSLRALDFKVVTEEMYHFCFLSASKLLILLHLLQTIAADLYRIQQRAQLHDKYGPNELLAGALAA